MGYSDIANLIRRLKYNKFTDLQEKVFSCEDAYLSKNLWICGDTSSGKTLIPLLLFAWEQNHITATKRMLYLVPYRTLATQKGREIRYDMSALFDSVQYVAVSTAEYRENDTEIIHGNPDISIMIYEKAYLFANDNGFLKQFDYIVFDEVGLVNDETRGIKIDLLLFLSLSKSRRVIVLSTPYYDWTNYIQQYDFTYIEHKERPVPLSILPIGRFTNRPFFKCKEDGGIDWDNSTVLNACSMQLTSGTPFLICLSEDTPPDSIALSLLGNALLKDNFNPVSFTQFIEQEGIDPNSPLCLALSSKMRHLLCNGIGVLYPELPTVVQQFLLDELKKDDGHLKMIVCTYDFFYCTRSSTYTAFISKVRRNQIIAEICRKHLKLGHKILIFINNRTEIHDIAVDLYRSLIVDELFDCQTPAEGHTYLDVLLEKMESTENDDELYGVISEDTCKAILSGIGIHSAALPQAFREFVEKELLYEDNGLFKIVVCTETLAFGINSNVDVVIVADMMNNGNYMTLNEYNNCAGRAGRLRSDKPREEQRGYIYPILNTKRLYEWHQISHCKELPLAKSQLTHIDVNGCGLYFLNMFSENTKKTRDTLEQELNAMPIRIFSGGAWNSEHLDELLDCLVNYGLLKQDMDPFFSDGPLYQLSSAGELIRGYGESLQSYEQICKSLKFSIQFGRLYLFDLIYHLCKTEKIKKDIDNIFSSSQCLPINKDNFNNIAMNRTDLFREGLLNDDLISYSLYHNILKEFYSVREIITTTLVSICFSSGLSIRSIYNNFQIPYGLIKKLCEEISYMLTLVTAIAHTHLSTLDYCRTLALWSDSFFFGVPADILELLDLHTVPPSTRSTLIALSPLSRFIKSHNQRPLSDNDQAMLHFLLQHLPVLRKNWKEKIDEAVKPFLCHYEKEMREII